jgi:hypothetical protein
LVCSNCGYDNPREHRYCGMCGTPFPRRDLTVPDAQSTLTFTSTPLEVTSSTFSVPAAEAQHRPVESRAVEAERHQHESPEVVAEAVAPEAEVTEPEVTADTASVDYVESHPEPPLPESLEPVAPPEEPLVAEAVLAEAAPIEAVETAPMPPVEVAETSLISPPEEATPVSAVEEPLPEESVAAETEPAAEAIQRPVLEVEAPAPPQPFVPPASEASPPPSHEEEPPPAETRRPAPFIVPRPTSPRREATATRSDTGLSRPGVVKPPIPEPFTPPPASAGMPTFKEVTEASGAPDISPFEPPAEKHPDEDRELKEYVANFRYTPPGESADELTMRSEVPKIDKEAPAEFHHASFDGDVPPPPEAGAHPTGEEYYPPGSSAANRSRFLDISEAPTPAATAQPAAHTGTSFLGLDDAATTAPVLEEAATPKGHYWLLWSLLLALLLIFGGLGYLEGRAQITHAFQGPIEITREGYEKLRQRIVELTKPVPESPAVQTEKQPEQPQKPASTEQSPAASSQPASSTQATPLPGSDSAATAANSQPSSSSASQTSARSQLQQSPGAAPPAVDTKAPADSNTETAIAEPGKPIEAPVPKVSSKPQPGQQELAKAVGASDPAAAAAWLWKATSRGNPVAPVRLADMYIKGQGVPRSCEQALVLLRSAATKENAPARNRLAALYANGTCVARDRVKAYQLMSSALAADPTSEWAQQNRQTLWNEMTPEERAEAQKYR